MRRLLFTFLLFFNLIILVSGAVQVSQNTIIPVQGINILGVSIDQPEFNFSTLNVTQANFWNTPSLGVLGDVNSTQFFSNAGQLNILESYLESFGDSQWLNLSGGNANQNINIGIHDFTATELNAGGLNLASGSITDSGGQISFGNEFLVTDGNIGIDTTSPLFPLDIVTSTNFLQIRLSSSDLDNTLKTYGFAARSYATANGDLTILVGNAAVAGNTLFWGGGGGSFFKGATQQIFFAREFVTSNSDNPVLVIDHNLITANYDLKMNADNLALLVGASSDGLITYNSTDMIINPKNVGSGSLFILGDMFADNNCYSDGFNCTTLDNVTNLSLTFLNLSGGNANQNIDIGIHDFTATELNAGTLNLSSGSITDSSGTISFGNENLITTGTLGAAATTLTGILQVDRIEDRTGELEIIATQSIEIMSTESIDIGANEDVEISGNQSITLTTTGGSSDITITSSDELFLNGTNGIAMDGHVTVNDNLIIADLIRLPDNIKIELGTAPGGDAQVFFDGSNLILNPSATGTHDVYIGATGTDVLRAANIIFDNEHISSITNSLILTGATSLILESDNGDITLDSTVDVIIDGTAITLTGAVSIIGDLQVDDVNINGNEVSVTGGDLELSASGTIMMLADVDMQGSMIQDTGGDLNLDAQDDISFTNNNLINIINLTATGLGTFGSLIVNGNVNLTNNTIVEIFCLNFSNGDTICGNNSVDITINDTFLVRFAINNTQFVGDVENIHNTNNFSRFFENNINPGPFATAVFSAENDADFNVHFGITSSGFDNGNSQVLANQGFLFFQSSNITLFANGGDNGFKWLNNPSNNKLFTDTNGDLMTLSKDGSLNVSNNITTINLTVSNTVFAGDVISQGLFDRIDNATEINSDVIHNTTLQVLYAADTSSNEITLNITFGTISSFQVWDAARKFNVNSVFVNVLNSDGVTIDHSAELSTRNKAFQFYFNGTVWNYGEIGKGQFVPISSAHDSIADFGNLIQENDNNSDITIIGSMEFTGIGIGSQNIISLLPAAMLKSNANWKGFFINGSLLDPTGEGADIVGLEIDFSDLNITNNPVVHGIEITVPPRLDAMHIHEGQLVIDNKPTNVITTEFSAIDIRVDTINLASSSVWSAMGITAVGSSTGTIAAILARNGVEPIRQEVGTFTTPSQTEFAGRKTGGGSTWVDGVDGNIIFVVEGDEVYLGSVAQFSQIEIIMGTIADKDVQPTFWYNTAGDSWTEFFPDDETSGFQSSSLVSWEPDAISALWTNDGDPGGASASTGYWIKIIRVRVEDEGTPTPTTMKTGTVEAFGWNEEGSLNINDLMLKSLEGTYTGGSAHVCVYNNGTLFASEGACP